MVKEIEIYDGKKIKVDFTKVDEYICKCFAIFLFIIYILFPDKEIGVGVVSFKNMVLIVVTVVTFITVVASNILKGNFRINKYFVMLGIYLVLILLSGLNSEYPKNVWFGINGRYEGIVTLFCYFVCFYLFYKGFKYNEKIFDLVTIAVLIVSGHGILQALLTNTEYFVSNHPYMAYSNFTNPNMFSSLLTMFLPIYLVKYFVDKKDSEYYIYVCGIIFAALVCAKTFGGYFTFIVYFIILSIYFLVIAKNKRKVLLKLLILVSVFLLVFIVLNICNDFIYFEEIGINAVDIKQTASGEKVEEFGNHRMVIWKMCLDIINKYPVLGVGPDSLGDEVFRNNMDKDGNLIDKNIADKAHNEYIHVAVTTGIPSLMVYLCFIFTIVISLLLKYIKYVKDGKMLSENAMMLVAVASSISAYLIQAFGNISIFAVAPLFWAMLGIGAKISNKNYNGEMLEDE